MRQFLVWSDDYDHPEETATMVHAISAPYAAMDWLKQAETDCGYEVARSDKTFFVSVKDVIAKIVTQHGIYGQFVPRYYFDNDRPIPPTA